MLAERPSVTLVPSVSGEILSLTERKKGFVLLSPLDIDTFTQPREKFEDIPELAQSIADTDLLHTPHVALFTSDTACLQYIDALNIRWGKSHTLGELRPIIVEGREMFLVLISGERRLRACKLLWTEGCPRHQEERGLKPCFADHDELTQQNGRILVQVRVNPTYNRGSRIQEAENIHHQIPAGRLALSIYNLWLVEKDENPSLTLKEFASTVSRSIETVRLALKFAEVPDIIQNWVHDKKIPYGIACELARLKDVGYEDWDLIRFGLKAHTDRLSVPAFRQYVNYLIKEKAGTDKMDMMEVFKEIGDKAATRSEAISKALKDDMQVRFAGARQQMEIIEDLTKNGFLTTESSPLDSRRNVEAMVGFAVAASSLTTDQVKRFGKGNQEKLGVALPLILENGNHALMSMQDE